MANLPGMAYRRRPNPDWSLEFASDGCRELLGAEPEDLTAGRIRLDDLIHPEDRERVWAEIRFGPWPPGVLTFEYRSGTPAEPGARGRRPGRADDQGRITRL